MALVYLKPFIETLSSLIASNDLKYRNYTMINSAQNELRTIDGIVIGNDPCA